MISTSGHDLIPSDAIETLITTLLPKTFLLTPNIPEALRLMNIALDDCPKTLKGLEELAKAVQQLGPKWVLLKGGHSPLNESGSVATTESDSSLVIDILTNGTEMHHFKSPYIPTLNTHGTGCSLASAIAANLALSQPLHSAITNATQYLHTSLSSISTLTTPRIGHGNSPIDHLHGLQTQPFHRNGFVPYCLSLPRVATLWPRYIYHPFVQQLASGSLPISNFRHYLIQDYLFLIQCLRAVKMAAFKARTLHAIKALDIMAKGYTDELDLHIAYCRDFFGLPVEEMEKARETITTTAYTRFVLDLAAGSTPFVMQCAMMPCIYGYGRIARWIKAAAGETVKIPVRGDGVVEEGEVKVFESGNLYWAWVEKYCSEGYDVAVRECRDELETLAVGMGKLEIEEGIRAFERAVEMEIGFWDEGLRG
jgi:hydroxymethylpyrimidine/phosphomethylpyrimidine kinase / thiaminase